MPVRIIESSNALSLEKKINDFLLENPNPVDIKYSICEFNKNGSSQDTTFSAMLIYK